MSILSTVKKGYMTIKTASGYVKLLPRTLATLVAMSDGKSVEEKITELNSKLSKQNLSFSNLGWTNPTYQIIKYGDIVMINYRCVVTNSAAHTVFYVASLPTNLRPSKVLHCAAWVADSPGNRHGASLQIQPTGELHLIAGVGNFVEAGFLATFILI